MAADDLLFSHWVRRPDREIDLGVAVLAIAEPEYSGLDVEGYLARLDAIGDSVRSRLAAGDEERRAMRRVLFDDLGFQGNEADYYDPKNSFLNEVIDRRLGLPITLSVLYLEVARRAGLSDVAGIGVPGHFLVRHGEAFIDVFRSGAEVDLAQLQQWLSRSVQRAASSMGPEQLRPASKRDIISRILRNLEAVYRRRGDKLRLAAVLERLTVVDSATRGAGTSGLSS